MHKIVLGALGLLLLLFATGQVRAELEEAARTDPIKVKSYGIEREEDR